MANFILLTASSPEVSSDGHYLYSPVSLTGTHEYGQLYVDWSNGVRSGTINYTDRWYNTFSSYQYSITQTDVTYGGLDYRFLYAVLSEYTAGSVTRQWFYTSTNNTITLTPPTSAHVYFLTLIYARIYTVTYNPNGGTVSPTSERVAYKDSVTLPTPTLADATLLGWYSGTTKVGDAGDSYTVTATITLTAKWNHIRSSGSFIFTASATSTHTSMNIGEWRIERSDIDDEDTLYWTITTPFVQAENNRIWNFVSFTFRAVYRGSSIGTEFTVRQPSGSWTTAGTDYRFISVPPDGTVFCRGIYGDYLIYNRNTGFLICNSSGSLAYGNQIISV